MGGSVPSLLNHDLLLVDTDSLDKSVAAITMSIARVDRHQDHTQQKKKTCKIEVIYNK